MKTKLIQIKDYLLLVDEEAEIKVDDILYNEIFGVYESEANGAVKSHYKIIAYYPLTKEAKELDLPFLPNPFEEVDIDKIIDDKNLGYHLPSMDDLYREGFKEGYKAAQSKQFSLKDVINAYDIGTDNGAAFERACEDHDSLEVLAEAMKYAELDREEFIRSLSTQQLPKEFVPEYEVFRDFDWVKEEINHIDRLKTITNSKGKEEIVGIYKY